MTRSLAAAVGSGLFATLLIAQPGQADQPPDITAADVGPLAPPTDVIARATDAGLRISWRQPRASASSPTHAIIDAGPGSCPITVPAGQRAALLPMSKANTKERVTPRVRLVYSTGISAPTSSSRSVRAKFRNGRYQPLQILSITDLHGALESSGRSIGVARLAAAFDRDRSLEPATITVSVGDNVGKSPLISDLFEERPTIEALNMMGLDVSTFGNHEHDRPLAHVQGMVEASDFTWTVANYSDLTAVNGPTKVVQPYALIDRGGMTIGVVGMNLARTLESVPPENMRYGSGRALAISPSTTGVIREAERAREAGADVVILLVHEGWTRNVGDRPVGPLVNIAQQVGGHVDVIFGGHTHEKFSTIVGDTLVVQTKALGQMYGRTRLCVDMQTGRVVGAVHGRMTLDDVRHLPLDSEAAGLVAEYAQRRDVELERVVGTVAEPLPHGGDPAIERTADFALGNFVADLIRHEYGADLALLNAGTFRGGLPAALSPPGDASSAPPSQGMNGPYALTLRDLMTSLSPQKVIVTTSISATHLRALIERGLVDYPSNPDFLQVSGIRVQFDPSLPEGRRIVGMWDRFGWPIVDSDRRFTVATLGYLATGKGRDARLFDRKTTVFRRAYLTSVLEVLAADMRLGRATFIPAPDGRLQRVGS